jgi:5'-deoxynucleotidase YfbR-like HD superfamily hydrolase
MNENKRVKNLHAREIKFAPNRETFFAPIHDTKMIPDRDDSSVDVPATVYVSSSFDNLEQPIASPDEEEVIKQFFQENPKLKSRKMEDLPLDIYRQPNSCSNYGYDPDEPWIQTYSGIRFTPLNPSSSSIIIEDIGHALSMSCRFAGHCQHFYSVAQHSVLVSYLCDSADALHGLLHDAAEAYLVDLPSPLKRSGFFDNFKEIENNLQSLIYKHFNLSEVEPISVKAADTKMLYTEARDLLKNKRVDWEMKGECYPFKIDPLSPQEAKTLFMNRFIELTDINKV